MPDTPDRYPEPDPDELSAIMSGPGPLMGAQPGEAPPACGRAEPHLPHSFGEHHEDHCRGACFCEQPASDAPAADPEAPKPCLREYVHDAHEYYDPDDGGAWRWCPGRTPADAVTDHAQAERRVRRLRTALIDIAGLEDGESQNLTDHELIDKAWDVHEPATPPGPSADEVRAAIEHAVSVQPDRDSSLYAARARVMEIFSPLIAERDDQNERLMIKSRYAEYYRGEADEQRQRADRLAEDLKAVSAELWRAVQDHNAERQRTERAEADRDALFEQNGEFQTDLAVATRTVADRDATIAELRDQVENRTCERDLEHHGRLAAMTERDRLREADARVRELAKGWIARGESAAMPSPFVARGREVLAALDGTDGGE